MTDKLIMRASDTLTDVAKNIFGDIVKTAYFSQYMSGDTSSKFFDNTVYAMDDAINQIDSNQMGIDLIDGVNVIIEFTNGVKVEFSTTEFGDISKPQNLEEIHL